MEKEKYTFKIGENEYPVLGFEDTYQEYLDNKQLYFDKIGLNEEQCILLANIINNYRNQKMIKTKY